MDGWMDGWMDQFIHLFMLSNLFILKQRNYKKTRNKKTETKTHQTINCNIFREIVLYILC